MKIRLREDLKPDVDRYYELQFRIYTESYLFWDRDFWEVLLNSSTVFRIEVNGEDAGDVLFERRGADAIYIVDFSLLPEYRGKGVGSAVLKQLKNRWRKVTAMTRREVLGFFLNSGFLLKKTINDYYAPGVHGYYVTSAGGKKSCKTLQSGA